MIGFFKVLSRHRAYLFDRRKRIPRRPPEQRIRQKQRRVPAWTWRAARHSINRYNEHASKGKNMKKAFDWEQCSKQHRPAHVAWLKANHDKPVTEVEYVEAYRDLRASDNRPNNARRYS